MLFHSLAGPWGSLEAFWTPWIYGITFVLGLCFGSFFHLVSYRLLTEQSILFPASFCPHTQQPLRWFENIPVVSYMLQGGKSRHSGQPIGVEYPLAEIFTGLLFVAVIWMCGLTWQGLLILFLVSNLIIITLTDLKESLIFHVNSLSLIPAGLIYSGFNLGSQATKFYDWGFLHIPDSFVSALIGIAVAYIFFEGLILLSETLFGTEGFGHGDTHLMMGVGAYLGWEFTLLSLVLGFILQAVPAIPLMIYQWFQRKDYISIGAGALSLFFATLPMWILDWGIPNLTVRAVLVLVSFILCIGSMLVFLKRAKEHQSFTYLPLGPALVLGSLAVLFFGNDILRWVIQRPV